MIKDCLIDNKIRRILSDNPEHAGVLPGVEVYENEDGSLNYIPNRDIEFLIAHSFYKGNANYASKDLPYSTCTIINHWRKSGLEIASVGWPVNEKRNRLIIDMIETNMSEAEIARKLGVSRQAVNSYIKLHKLTSRSTKDVRVSKRLQRIKELSELDYTKTEIARELGISHYYLRQFLSQHPEIPKPKLGGGKNLKKIEQIKQLLKEGLNQVQVASRLATPFSIINRYLRKDPELRKIYDQHRSKG